MGASLFTTVSKTLPAVTRGAVAVIVEQIPEYRSVDSREHHHLVERQLGALLDGLEDGRGPSDLDLASARELGGVRALHGLELRHIISAYHLGYEFLWMRLSRRAAAEGTEMSLALLAAVDTFWMWTARVSTAAADGHAAVTAEEQIQRAEAGHRFVSNLYAGQAEHESTARLAQSVGFNPTASFTVIALPSAEQDRDTRQILERLARLLRVPSYVESRGNAVQLLLQTADREAVLQHTGDLPAGAGVSATRSGLGGLALALRDSDAAMALAAQTGAHVIDYERSWLPTILLGHRTEIAPFITPRTSTIKSHLADAVLAFAGNGFSVATAGEILHVHPNTVRYRLDRWQVVTGWDVRSLNGLQSSLAFLQISTSSPLDRRG